MAPATEGDHVGTYASNTLGNVVVQKAGSAMQITINGKTDTLTPEWADTYSFIYTDGYPLDVNFWRVNGVVKYIVSGVGVGAKQ